MSETSYTQTKRNRQQYCTVKLIKQAREVTFFNLKIEKFVGGNLSHFQCLPHVEWWNSITSVCLIQFGNNRNDHFRYFLGVRLIKVSFKVNKKNKFRDFGYCPLNRGCPLDTGFTVYLCQSCLVNATEVDTFIPVKAKVSLLINERNLLLSGILKQE